jgi:hypothetical protein
MASLDFVGTGVSWIGTQSPDQGVARVYVDGSHVGDADQFGEAREYMVTSYTIANLTHGAHTISIEVTGTKNPQSTGYRIQIDAFDVMP